MPVRIYEISKKLGLDNKQVIAKAKALGLTSAKVASSLLDKITAEYLEEQILLEHPELAPPPESVPVLPLVPALPKVEAPVPAKDTAKVNIPPEDTSKIPAAVTQQTKPPAIHISPEVARGRVLETSSLASHNGQKPGLILRIPEGIESSAADRL